MAKQAAHVSSIDAVRAFKGALQQFEADVHEALVQLELEARRPVQWIESDRSLYWPREVRKATDVVSEARLALQRCELTISGEDDKSCYDERKALEKAKRRLRKAEEKVQAVRRWKVKIHKEVEEFEVQIAKLRKYLESDFLRGVAVLERLGQALERYVERQAPAKDASPATGEAE